MSNVITYDRLVQVLNYDPETGIFTWRKSLSPYAPIGRVSGTLKMRGYVGIRVDKKDYLAHRLAWLYVYGYLPENPIDHINRVKDDNRITNLREVSATCNMRNRGVTRNNTSGVVGVRWRKDKKIWLAYIKVDGKLFELGSYKDKGDAVQARWEAEVKYKFPNCNSTSTAYQYLQKHKINLDI